MKTCFQVQQKKNLLFLPPALSNKCGFRYNIAAVQSCISLLGNSTEGEDMDDLWKIDKQKV